MTDSSVPHDPAEVLKQHFTTTQVPDTEPQYKMSERNRKKLEKIRQRVRELRGQ
jgi:hypothetical protein